MSRQKKQAAQRGRAAVRPRADPHVEQARAAGASGDQLRKIAAMSDPEYSLELVRQELRQVELRRQTLLSERDALVVALRARGVGWKQLAEAAGVSHVALIRRQHVEKRCV